VPVGTWGVGGAFSFYPTKNLGALGDGGAVITDHADVAERVRRLRNGGQDGRYRHQEAGVNSRLDDLQAAVLRAKLSYLARWTARRRELAAVYRRLLPPALPLAERERGHVYHLFAVRSAARDALQASLAAAGIETLIHYPLPLSRQPAFAHASAPAITYACPVADRATRELLSLPLHPRLTDAAAERVAALVLAGLPAKPLTT
jgi:dTDP-4-amino-4,6-dideoxygalactose transaminase